MANGQPRVPQSASTRATRYCRFGDRISRSSTVRTEDAGVDRLSSLNATRKESRTVATRRPMGKRANMGRARRATEASARELAAQPHLAERAEVARRAQLTPDQRAAEDVALAEYETERKASADAEAARTGKIVLGSWPRSFQSRWGRVGCAGQVGACPRGLHWRGRRPGTVPVRTGAAQGSVDSWPVRTWSSLEGSTSCPSRSRRSSAAT